MSNHANRGVLRRYLEEIVSGGRLDLAEELIAPDVVFTSPYTPEPITSRHGLVGMLGYLHAAFPDFLLSEDVVLADGDLVASRWVASGTHIGTAFGGRPASGRRFEITGMSIYEAADGRVVEGWVSDDTMRMASQLGLVPEPTAAE